MNCPPPSPLSAKTSAVDRPQSAEKNLLAAFRMNAYASADGGLRTKPGHEEMVGMRSPKILF
jgi:hypothetical protein